ncbi:MAG: SLBB domain-containing protein [Candidatus Sericytochromatia bacterium]|nr:SLBB domain-containing protein [Candidatus Sericytochromatia bacterium]
MTIFKRLLSVFLAALLGWQVPVLAQQQLGPPLLPDLPQPQLAITRQPPDEQPLQQPGSDYRLASEDLLSLQLWNRQLNLSYELPVNAQGEIFVPRLGTLKLSGQTLTEARAAVQQRLGTLQNTPQDPIQLALFLKSPRRIAVLLSGHVSRPGQYRLPWGTTLLEALRRAGGIRESGSVRQIQLNGQAIDLQRFYAQGQTQANPVLRSGAVIYVPPLSQRVAVLGEVQQPGIYEIQPGDTVAELLAWAGGTKTTAVPGQIQRWSAGLLQHKSQRLESVSPETLLGSGDILQIPARRLEAVNPQVFIRGQVRQAGAVNWREGLQLLDALQQAGGELNSADLGAVMISRQSAQGRSELRVNLQAFLNGQSTEGNPLLQPGDAILIPESFFNVRNITELTTLILSTLGIVSVVINLSGPR